ncbi:carbohydrate esterase family 5 protein [Diaporthe amygdali]|uniref:carbohydrate esterase family 5 protein n=1 Tax=Phomopsis amygdali TaxID=1214568 RepID=UPI0022FE82CE|nr:carbohydrate esterase family 5 protein [Diaporthe amygdali]KAJ0122399.1 carbohydrate esterase family 5 protein [Diaporthe amygdali]
MITPLLLSGLVAMAAAQATNTSSQACVSGNAVHLIVARASLEPPGFGVLANISTRVIEQLPGSNAEAVVYPATLDMYPNSEGQGVTAMTQLVNSYAQACPSSKMVLMGYSQGAQVTADTVCGSTVSGFAKTQAISTSVLDKVSAIMLMGDPTHAINQPYDEGTSTKNGVFPRNDSSGCAPVANKMVSFCNSGDTFCDSGQNLTVHLSYVQDNGTSAVNFITQKVKGGSGSSNSSSSSGSSGSSSGSGTVTTNAAARGVAVPAGFALLAEAARMLAV